MEEIKNDIRISASGAAIIMTIRILRCVTVLNISETYH